MFYKLKAMRYLKKKSTSILNDQRGSYVISFVFIFLIIFMTMMMFVQVGIMMIKNTEIQTATDAASLAGASTIEAVPIDYDVEIIENNGVIDEVNLKAKDWEIIADEEIADDAAKTTYRLNANLDDDDFTGELKNIDETNHTYTYQAEIKDKTPPFMVLKSLFKNHEGIYFYMKSISKTRVVLPEPESGG